MFKNSCVVMLCFALNATYHSLRVNEFFLVWSVFAVKVCHAGILCLFSCVCVFFVVFFCLFVCLFLFQLLSVFLDLVDLGGRGKGEGRGRYIKRLSVCFVFICNIFVFMFIYALFFIH